MLLRVASLHLAALIREGEAPAEPLARQEPRPPVIAHTLGPAYTLTGPPTRITAYRAARSRDARADRRIDTG